MASKKAASPQPVTLEIDRFDVYAINESQTKVVKIDSIAIYGKTGTVATLSCGDLVRTMGPHASFVVTMPAMWNSHRDPDFTEARAHIVTDKSYVRRACLYIPAEAVTIASVRDIANRGTGYTERYYTVAEFPTAFCKWYRHPFNRYAAEEAVSQLAKDRYDILTPERINTPQAQERIAKAWEAIKEFAAETARIEALSDAEYIAECIKEA